MKLRDVLAEKQPEILDAWFEEVTKTYPAETANFLKERSRRFANPVGSTIHEGLAGILDSLLRGEGDSAITPFLDNIIRIRAVQDFTPSQAVFFMIALKKIVREKLGDVPIVGELGGEIRTFEDRVDTLCLLAFDIFMQCREKLYDIKANELRNMTYRLLQQANMLTEKKADDAGSADTHFLPISRKEVST